MTQDTTLPATGTTHRCKLATCGKAFLVPASARNKEFCCASHRYAWHAEQRKRGLELLHAQNQGN